MASLANCIKGLVRKNKKLFFGGKKEDLTLFRVRKDVGRVQKKRHE